MSTNIEPEPLPIQHIQTVEIRHNEERNDYRLTVTGAARAAGLGKGATFQFKPYELDKMGVIPALGAAAGEDAPRDQNTRTVAGRADDTWLEIPLPRPVVEALTESVGTDLDEIEDHAIELPLIDVFAGDRMIAIAPAEGFDVPIGALPEDPDRLIDNSRESVRLEAIQTARPRVKMNQEGTSRMVMLTATRTLREAGLAPSDQPHSVSYHPNLARDLSGLIPVVGYERAAGVHDPEYSVYENRDGDGAAFSLGLPPGLLEALGLSVEELIDLERNERPRITVYAADGAIGLKLPTEREIAVERDRRGELVDIESIGEAVVERLRERGYSSPEDLEGISREELLEIEGVSTNRADRILADLDERRGA